MVQAYLVDLDGTLADTSTANYLAYAAALAEVQVAIEREQFEKETAGLNWRQFLPAMLKSRGCCADPAEVAARKVHHYRTTARHVRFNEALIELLRGRGAETSAALVTSASAMNVKTALAAREGLRDLFDVVVTGDDVTRHKPDPQAFELAASLLHVRAEQCLVFEDSGTGVAAGLAFGAKVLKISLIDGLLGDDRPGSVAGPGQ